MPGYTYSNVSSNPSGPPEIPINSDESDWGQQLYQSTSIFMGYDDSQSTYVLGDKAKSGVWARVQNVRKRYFSGRSFTLRLAISLLSAVLIINIVFTIVALVVPSKLGLGRGILMSGKCHAVNLADIGLHVLINVLSTTALLGSTTFMQLLSSPTRKEIDRAHAKGCVLDVGVSSLRTLNGISKRRVFLWVVLALSALPLHLLYNAVIYTVIGTREYYYAVVTEDFLSGAPYDPCAAASNIGAARCTDPLGILQVMQQNALKSYTRLDQESCIKTYSNDLLTDHTHVLAVTSDTNNTNSIFIWGDAVIWSDGSDPPSGWICSQDEDPDPVVCDASSLLRDPSSWIVHGHPIQYCLSLPVTQSCQLEFNFQIMAIVLVCNAIKLLTALYVLFGMTSFTSEALFTVGDALQSFLVRNDVHTKDMCLAGEHEFPAYWWSGKGPRILSSTKMRWYRSTSRRLWITVILSSLCAIGLVSLLCFLGATMKVGGAKLSQTGFGTLRLQNVVFTSALSTSSAALIANTPQLVFVILDLFCTNLFHCIVAAKRWTRFATKAKALRVSTPTGDQRGTYLLGLPTRYAAPLLASSIFLHWLISQSIFLARANMIAVDGTISTDPDHILSNCGYSVLPGIGAIMIGTLLLITVIALGMQRYEGKMPLVATCSAAISAAAHSEYDKSVDATKPLMWGVTWVWPDDSGESRSADSVGHCSFSSNKVRQPMLGASYR